MLRRDFCIGGLALAALGTGAARAQSGTWHEGAPLPAPLQEIYPTLYRGEIWIAGGLTPIAGGIAASDRTFIFDPLRGVWREGPRLREGLHHPHLVALGEELFLLGGFAAGRGGWHMQARIDRLVDGEWREAGAFPMPIAESGAVAIAGAIHLATGRTPRGAANEAWTDHADIAAHFVFDPATGDVSEAPPAPTARNSAAACVAGDRFFVIGGRTVEGGNLAAVEVFDPASGAWESRTPMPEARGGIAAATLGGAIFVFGGEYFDRGRGVFADVLRYDIAGDRWERLGPMPSPRHGLGAVAVGEEIFVPGGARQAGAIGTSAAMEIFAPRFA